MGKRIAFCLGFVIFTFMSTPFHVYANDSVARDYQKYGRIALAAVKEEYPEQGVGEYQYLGRRKNDGTKVVDSFRFELKQKNNSSVFIHVRVLHDLEDGRHHSLIIEEKEYEQ